MNTNEHWNKIYSKVSDSSLGWYEDNFSKTLKFLNMIDNLEKRRVFICGCGVSKIAEIVLEKCSSVIFNEISEDAINILRDRIDTKNTEFFIHDLSKEFKKDCDFWFDRAVLHFLQEEQEINRYFENLKNSLSSNGYVLFIEFYKQEPHLCANLPVHQYTSEELASRLGDEFFLVSEEVCEYFMPSKHKRLYQYTLFRRDSKQ